MLSSFGISVQIFFIIFARILGVFITSPFWNSPLLFFRFRLLVVLMFSYILLPMVEHQSGLTEITLSHFWFLLLLNLLLGLFIGFCISLLFSIFQIVGELWSFQMGFSINQALDPYTGEQNAIFAQMVNFLALLIFIAVDGHLKVLFLIYDSFSADSIQLHQFNLLEFIKNLPTAMGSIFIHALELSLTLVGSIFISTLFVGMLAKAAPQLNVFQFGMPVYIVIGFVLILYLVPNFVSYTGNYIDQIFREIYRWLSIN